MISEGQLSRRMAEQARRASGPVRRRQGRGQTDDAVPGGRRPAPRRVSHRRERRSCRRRTIRSVSSSRPPPAGAASVFETPAAARRVSFEMRRSLGTRRSTPPVLVLPPPPQNEMPRVSSSRAPRASCVGLWKRCICRTRSPRRRGDWRQSESGGRAAQSAGGAIRRSEFCGREVTCRARRDDHGKLLFVQFRQHRRVEARRGEGTPGDPPRGRRGSPIPGVSLGG